MKRQVLCLAAVALILLSAPALLAERPGDLDVKSADNGPQTITGPMTRQLATPVTAPAHHTEGTFTVTYDDGVVTAAPTVSSFCYGNQFNTISGGTINTHSITAVEWFAVSGVGTDNFFVSIFGPVAGTSASLYGSPSVPLNNGSGAFNTAIVGPYTGMGSFLAGAWYIAGDTVGLGSGTVGGQGHHGMMINDIVGTGFATLPSMNALVRARTNPLPVELLGFSVSDD